MALNLYHVQDADRPMWVVAGTYGDAVEIWKRHIAPENKCLPADIEDPLGISLVCEANDLILFGPVAANS